jgi:hypothetical protein
MPVIFFFSLLGHASLSNVSEFNNATQHHDTTPAPRQPTPIIRLNCREPGLSQFQSPAFQGPSTCLARPELDPMMT